MLQISNTFSQHTATMGDVYSTLIGPYEVLRNGGWIGVGADKFFTEMEEIFTQLQKVQAGLDQISAETNKIGNHVSNAEQTILQSVRPA